MKSRTVVHGVLIVIGVGVSAALRHARYNDIDVPGRRGRGIPARLGEERVKVSSVR